MSKVNIIGYRIFPKEEMLKNNIFLKIKEFYPSGVRILSLSNNDLNDDLRENTSKNWYTDCVSEIDIDFNTQRLFLIIERIKSGTAKAK